MLQHIITWLGITRNTIYLYTNRYYLNHQYIIIKI